MDDEANVARAGAAMEARADARLGGGGGVAMDVDRSKNDEVFGESLMVSALIVASAGTSARGLGGGTSGAQDVVKRSLRDDVDGILVMAPKLVLGAAVIPPGGKEGRRGGGPGTGGYRMIIRMYVETEGGGKWERQRKEEEDKGEDRLEVRRGRRRIPRFGHGDLPDGSHIRYNHFACIDDEQSYVQHTTRLLMLHPLHT
jgi:hypothetical protein